MNLRKQRTVVEGRLPLDILIQGWEMANNDILVPGHVFVTHSEDEYDHFHISDNVFGAEGMVSGPIPNGTLEDVPLGWRLVIEHQINNVILAQPGMQEYLQAEAQKRK